MFGDREFTDRDFPPDGSKPDGYEYWSDEDQAAWDAKHEERMQPARDNPPDATGRRPEGYDDWPPEAQKQWNEDFEAEANREAERAEIPADGSPPEGYERWPQSAKDKWRARRDEAVKDRVEAGEARTEAAGRQGDRDYSYDDSEIETSGHVSSDTTANEGNDERWFAVDVPVEGHNAYLRLGARPSPGNLAAPGGEDYGLHSTSERWAGGPTPDDGDGFAKGFIHPPYIGSTEKLYEASSWVDHAESHRLTTTGGSKVEVIEGNYKLIACGGKCGIDFSGGHMQAWAVTPGYISQAVTEGNDATELLVSDKYTSLTSVGKLIEHTEAETYVSYTGQSLDIGRAGKPPIATEFTPRELKKYEERTKAKVIDSVTEASDTQAERVSAGKIISLTGAKGILEHTKIGGGWPDVGFDGPSEAGFAAGSIVSITENGVVKQEETISASGIQSTTTVGGVRVEEGTTATGMTEQVMLGGYLAKSELNMGALTERTVMGATVLQSELSSTGTDEVMIGVKNSEYTAVVMNSSTLLAGTTSFTDMSGMRSDVCASILWSETNAGIKIENTAMLKTENVSTKVETAGAINSVFSALTILL